MCATTNKRSDIVNLLLLKGADAKLVDVTGENALHWAARVGAPSIILKALIDAGVDPQAKDIYNQTPADIARGEKYRATATFLEQYCMMAPTKSANLMV
jgi:ankyrin repeat protein